MSVKTRGDNMFKRISLIAVGCIFSILLVSNISFAKEELTPQQLDRIEERISALRASVNITGSQESAIRNILVKSAEEFNQKSKNLKGYELSTIGAQLRTDSKTKVFAVLSKDQRDKLNEMETERRNKEVDPQAVDEASQVE